MPSALREKSRLKIARYPNARAWWDALGNVPLERIVFDPVPGTATEADVLRLDDHEDRICELVDGTLVEKTMGFEESLVAARLIELIGAFVRKRKLGVVSSSDGMMRILKRRVRIPDVGFISKARMAKLKKPIQPIPVLAPDLAIEVLSESNTAKEMSIKLREYFEAGTRLVWYVDPKTGTIDVYNAPDSRRRLGPGDKLTGGSVLPGFSVRVSEIFDVV
jgi:Uma2 family endonuclease